MDGTGEREKDIYDAVTDLFLGVPASMAVPVLCEALVHALNCAEKECREEMRDVALATILEHVDLNKDHVVGYAA